MPAGMMIYVGQLNISPRGNKAIYRNSKKH